MLKISNGNLFSTMATFKRNLKMSNSEQQPVCTGRSQYYMHLLHSGLSSSAPNKDKNNGKNEEQLPQKTVGRLLANSRPTVGQRLANSRTTVDRQSDDSRPTVGQLLADCWPTVGRLLANSRPTVFWGSCSSFFPLFLSLLGADEDKTECNKCI